MGVGDSWKKSASRSAETKRRHRRKEQDEQDGTKEERKSGCMGRDPKVELFGRGTFEGVIAWVKDDAIAWGCGADLCGARRGWCLGGGARGGAWGRLAFKLDGVGGFFDLLRVEFFAVDLVTRAADLKA
jgi:hypothetical protein